MLSTRDALTAEERSGYLELTRIRNDLYIILSDFSYRNPLQGHQNGTNNG